jgi:hypothetical protein
MIGNDCEVSSSNSQVDQKKDTKLELESSQSFPIISNSQLEIFKESTSSH